MPDILVLYGSKYGATRQYATWIADALKADLQDVKKVNKGETYKYNTIIVGGALYAGGVLGLSFIRKNYARIKSKNIILFTCGIADPAITNNAQKIKGDIEKRLPAHMLQNIRLFYLRGKIDYSKLTALDRLMMKALKKSLESKPHDKLSEEDKAVIATYGKTINFVNKDSIIPIVDLVKTY